MKKVSFLALGVFMLNSVVAMQIPGQSQASNTEIRMSPAQINETITKLELKAQKWQRWGRIGEVKVPLAKEKIIGARRAVEDLQRTIRGSSVVKERDLSPGGAMGKINQFGEKAEEWVQVAEHAAQTGQYIAGLVETLAERLGIMEKFKKWCCSADTVAQESISVDESE
ncbi:MAG: hypothetical protein LBQ08_03185 [Holosporaceae bacterium]|nr:hypothetical protein [Holosporaceae bacterium]